MNIIGTINNSSQDVAINGILNLGATYRRFEKPRCADYYDFTGTSIILQKSGMYHITVTAVASGDTSGVLTLNIAENGVVIPSAFSSETITTATTELRTLVIDYVVLVDTTNVLGYQSVVQKAISLINTGIAATYTNVRINIEKVV